MRTQIKYYTSSRTSAEMLYATKIEYLLNGKRCYKSEWMESDLPIKFEVVCES